MCPACVCVCVRACVCSGRAGGVAASQGRVDSLHKDSARGERQVC